MRLLAVAGAVLMLATASCGGGGETVEVTLQEFSIGTEPTSAGDGAFSPSEPPQPAAPTASVAAVTARAARIGAGSLQPSR